MNKEFNKWWDEDDLTTEGNNFVDGTPAYWAWEGWCAAVKAEREACAKVCDEADKDSDWPTAANCAATIRARSNT
jgi:hypothetical protein